MPAVQEFCLQSRLRGNNINIDLDDADGIACHLSNGMFLNGKFLNKAPLWNFFKHPARAHIEVRPADTRNIEQSLRSVAAFSRFMSGSGIEWYLTGGIAIDLVKSKTFRQHGDLDIVLPVSEAPKLRKFLEEKGISAYRRFCTATYYRDDRLTVLKRAIPSEQDFGRSKTLKLFLSCKERLLPVVDIHFVLPESEGNQILCNRKIVSLPFPIKGDRQFKCGSETVTCCDLRYILFLKSDDNPRNFYDAERVAQEMPPQHVAQVLKLREKYAPVMFPPVLYGIAGKAKDLQPSISLH